jgi:S-adenosyl-L-methionine hydrolase (adenosine-forming)
VVTRGPVTFLSDYGLQDEFVGIVHRVIAQQAPGVTVIDLTHQVPAHDVRAGALTLWRAAPWLAPGVILAVVDPGVGTSRRAVVIEVAGAGAVLVGPDNGLLLPAATSLGRLTGAVALPPCQKGGATFAGRDVFAPAAAELAQGADIANLGPPIDPGSLLGTPVPEPQTGPDGSLQAEVLWVDRFGNAQLNVRPADADHLGRLVELHVGSRARPARRVASFGDLEPDEMGLVTDSYGLLAVTYRGASAAARAGLEARQEVRIGPARG